MNSQKIKSALRHLKKDKNLRRVIQRHEKPAFNERDPFAALVSAIIYQQLSGKAAGTIHKRFLALYSRKKHPAPKDVLKTSDAKFQSVGVSRQKRSYLKDLSKKFMDSTIVPKKFPKMTDEEIREHLIAVKGIGRWTADMFLMFTLHRPDVLPTGDLGIQKGFQKLFKLRTLPNALKMEKLAEPWRPHRTVASWYLWKIVDTNADSIS